jgi:hypothetical protein
MNPAFERVIAAPADERRGLFLATANRRGTSLSKAYGLISRFSEDIDITVFREDLGQHLEIADLEGLSGKQQRRRLESLKLACKSYVKGPLKDRLNRQIGDVFRTHSIAFTTEPVARDEDDGDGQTLLVHYPSVMTSVDTYIAPSVKIEAGARSALDPHRAASLQPFVAQDMPTADLTVSDVVTIDAERTFWDKVVILHGLRRWHDARGILRQNGQRISRHYYDIHKLMESDIGQRALTDRVLASDCSRHALMFFNSPDLDLLHARPGSYAIAPTADMVTALKRDYQSMAGMVFGDVPGFDDVLAGIVRLEQLINRA